MCSENTKIYDANDSLKLGTGLRMDALIRVSFVNFLRTYSFPLIHVMILLEQRASLLLIMKFSQKGGRQVMLSVMDPDVVSYLATNC